jgi:hypothetical protein
MAMDHSKTHSSYSVALDATCCHKKCTSSMIKAVLATAPAKSKLAHSFVSVSLVQGKIFVINWVAIVNPILTNCTIVVKSARILSNALIIRHCSYTSQLATFWNLGISCISFSRLAFLAPSKTGPLTVFAKLVGRRGIQESHCWARTVAVYQSVEWPRPRHHI